MHTMNEQLDLTSFDQIVEPIAVRVATPRCADGNGTLTHLLSLIHI